MNLNIIGGPIGSDTDLMLDVYMTRDQREAYERLRRDAARYRWLRAPENDDAVEDMISVFDYGDSASLKFDGDELDKAIDAAMNGANG